MALVMLINSVVIILLLISFTVCCFALLKALRHAPIGYQDDTGFNYGQEQETIQKELAFGFARQIQNYPSAQLFSRQISPPKRCLHIHPIFLAQLDALDRQ